MSWRPGSLSSCSTFRRAPPAAHRAGLRRGAQLSLTIIASAFELPIQRVAVEDGAAFGVALLGGGGGGVWRSWSSPPPRAP
jgi:hypothetical protein